MDSLLKKTPLDEVHRRAGAKMVPFAGYDMPVQYKGILHEHQVVRHAAGLFDVSHMGQLLVSGKGAFTLLQFLTTNNISKLTPGKVQYSCLTNDSGGIIDDLLVYQLAAEEYLLVVNASNIDKDLNWINTFTGAGAEVRNMSDDWSLIAVQGPAAQAVVQTLTETPLGELAYYTFTTTRLAGIQDVIISATGYTGEEGFELYVPAAAAVRVWESLLIAGEPFGLEPAGLGARDTLRLEMGYCLYGHDINENTTPLEAGLGWVTDLKKDFCGADVLRGIKANGVSRKLCGLEMIERAIPRQGYSITDNSGNRIGEVTSGTQSPSLGKAIALGYIDSAYAQTDNVVFIRVRETLVAARVVKPPFTTNQVKKELKISI